MRGIRRFWMLRGEGRDVAVCRPGRDVFVLTSLLKQRKGILQDRELKKKK